MHAAPDRVPRPEWRAVCVRVGAERVGLLVHVRDGQRPYRVVELPQEGFSAACPSPAPTSPSKKKAEEGRSHDIPQEGAPSPLPAVAHAPIPHGMRLDLSKSEKKGCCKENWGIFTGHARD